MLFVRLRVNLYLRDFSAISADQSAFTLGFESSVFYYPTALRRVQITPKTSTNITRYLYSRGPVRQVFSQRASDELD